MRLIFKLPYLWLTLFTGFIGRNLSVDAQNVIPGCESYRNLSAFTHKVKTIEVYNLARKLKIAQYEFDTEGYLVRSDTLLHFDDTFPSQKRHIRYSSDRSQIMDSTINFSKNYADVPPNSVRIKTLQCSAGNKEIKEVRYNLGNRKDSILRVYHFNRAGSFDTVYRIDVYSGDKQVESYMNYRPGTTPITYDRNVSHICWVHPDYNPQWTSHLDFYFDTLGRLVSKIDYIQTKETFTFNRSSLLIEQVTDYCFRPGYYCQSSYFNNMEYNSQRITFSYNENLLYERKSYACQRDIQTNGKVTYKTIGVTETMFYTYMPEGLLKQMKNSREVIDFRYKFFK